MGYSLSWIAIDGKGTEEVQKILGLKATGKQGNYGEHALVGRQLPNGWYIFIANICDDKITESKILTELSKRCQVIACSIEEHVMFSSCTYWNKGRKVWSVRHDGDRGALNIVNSGKLPKNYSSLKNELLEKQKAEGGESAEVDYIFELPLEMAKQVVGFKHDEEMNQADESYEIYDLGFFRKISRIVLTSRWVYFIGFLLFIIVFAFAMGILVAWLKDVVKSAAP